MWIYVASVTVTFIAVFLKGMQYKNVIGGHIKTMAATSYMMAFFDVAAINVVVSGGWTTAFTAGTGAALGMVAASLLHDKIFRRQ